MSSIMEMLHKYLIYCAKTRTETNIKREGTKIPLFSWGKNESTKTLTSINKRGLSTLLHLERKDGKTAR